MPNQEYCGMEYATAAAGWPCGNLIYVYCTYCTDENKSTSLLTKFFLKGDRCIFKGRQYFLCLVVPKTSFRRPPCAPGKQRIFFVWEDDFRPEGSTPASLSQISIELDAHTLNDWRTCLLRKNGRNDRQAYAEVRCDFSVALRTAVALWARNVSITALQSEAALYGGAVPSEESKAARVCSSASRHSYQIVLPENWTITEHEISPCPVFVTTGLPEHIIDAFLEAVNLPTSDPDHALRVTVLNIETSAGAKEPDLEDPQSVSQLSNPTGTSTTFIYSLIRHLSSIRLSSRYFIILDGLTIPARYRRRLLNNPTEEHDLHDLTCIIGDASTPTVNKADSLPLLVRSAFDSCGDILDALTHSGGSGPSLRAYANDAAVDYGGCIAFPVSRNGGHTLASDTRTNGNQTLASGTGTNAPGSSSSSSSRSSSTDATSTPATASRSLDAKSKRLQTTPAPEKVKRDKKGLERGRDAVTPDYAYDPLLPHGCALGVSQPSVGEDGGGSGAEEEGEEEPGSGQASRPRSSPPRGGGGGAGRGADAGETRPRASKRVRVDSAMDGQGLESDDDGWYDVRLPEVTGLTQMM